MPGSWAEKLYAARRDCEPIAPLTSAESRLGLEDAYSIQREFTGLLVADGARLVGYKLGLTSKPMQDMLGVDQPDFGPVLSSLTVNSGASVAINELIHPRIEAELAFELGSDLSGPNVALDDVRSAVKGARASMEIIDSRIADWEIGLVDTVADLASTGLVVLGDELIAIDGWDPRLCGVVVFKNDELVTTGAGAAALGDPLEAIAWLANTLGRFGTVLKAGHVVLTGSLHAAFPFAAGDSIRAEFDRLGSVDLSVT